MTDLISSLIRNLKPLPGVYLMYNSENEIIYIGKAKNLKNRVSQYFLRPHEGKTAKMVSEVDHFETIITENEKEALILEMNLIKHHYPRFNILLKDDSHYPYIALKKGGDPVLSIKRNNKDKSYYYFGPFPNSSAAREIIDLINKIFPLRKCKTLPHEACLYYHLGQCLAPCINEISKEVYAKLEEDIRKFLGGDTAKVKREYTEKMKKASSEMKYELAEEYKDILEGINHLETKQRVEMSDKTSRDIISFASRDSLLALTIFTYVNGMLLGKKSYVVEKMDEEEEQVIDLICQYYDNHDLPKEIILNNDHIREECSQLLGANIVSKSKGPLYDLVALAKENSLNALDEYFLTARIDEGKEELLTSLQNLLGISFPSHIEMFDNSHTAGEEPVGVMVCFINGEKAPKLYRRYKINGDNAKDDLASMREVVYRRYHRLKDEGGEMPSLILIDGGYTQLEAALSALSELELDISTFALFKDDKHQTKGLLNKDKEVIEINDKSLFFLLTRMQDEVHRFAITFHKERRSKRVYTSYLDGIKGIGDKRKEKLLSLYPSESQIRNATLEELEEILPTELSKELYNRFHEE